MADIKSTRSRTTHTRQDFPEVKDKIIDGVELSADHEYYGITIRFQDNTTLTFTVEPCVIAFPVYAGWEHGEEKTLKRYRPVHSRSSRV